MFRTLFIWLQRLRKRCFLAGRLTSAAEAGVENKPAIAAVNRCATQIKRTEVFFRSLFRRASI
jgi:hypothetical protein